MFVILSLLPAYTRPDPLALSLTETVPSFAPTLQRHKRS
jgi:hypothetical protein